MDWSTGQPELPSGSLILFRSTSLGNRGRQFMMVKRLGCGQSFVQAKDSKLVIWPSVPFRHCYAHNPPLLVLLP